MKKILILTAVMGLFFNTSYGQTDKSRREKMMQRVEKAKMKFFEKQLKLGEEDFAKFEKWYKEFQGKKKLANLKNIFKKIEADKTPSESDAQQYLKELAELRTSMVNIRTNEVKALANLLSAKTALLFEKTEMDFRRKIIKRRGGKRGKKAKGWSRKKGKKKRHK